MRRSFWLLLAVVAAFSPVVRGQDDGEQKIKKALIGRAVLVKMDLPAINSGIDFVLDNTDVSYNAAKCSNLLKEYGIALKNGSQARITDVRISNRGIEMDLDGGGLPTSDWFVGSLKLSEPEPLAKSERELDIERQMAADPSANTASHLRSELDYERQRRTAQDDRNRENFRRMDTLRRQYIDENRTKWGSKIIVLVRTRKESVKMRDMVKALGKYVELLPNDKPAE
ncbi:MAG: hypothetical protein QM785_02955 [Pyrinomonadaceae bacterium]